MKHSLRRLLYTALLLGFGFGFFFLVKPDFTTNHSVRKEKVGKEHEQEKEKSNKRREEYFFRMLRNPATNSIPKNVRASELAYARHLMNWQQMNVRYSSSSTASVTNAYTWSQAGPYDVGGRTRALSIDINNSSHIVAGGASGGIWESKDAGQTWSLRNTANQNLSVTDVVQDPLNPQVWYYSSGEYDNSMSTPYKGTGIYKSTDNGDSWQVLSSTQVPSDTSYYSPYQYISKIAISPTTGTLFLASNNFGIYSSTDGGQSFTHLLGSSNDHNYTGLAVSKNGYILVALSADGFSSTPINAAGLYLSTDDGQTWKNITPSGFPSYFERTVIAFAPSQPNIAYTMTYDGSTTKSQSKITFYKLTFKGDTLYSADNRSANIPNYGGKVGQFNVQNNYNMVISVKPDNPDFVVIGATNLFRSKDGFSTKPTQDYGWIGGYDTANNISGYPGQHPDEHIAVFDPSNPNHVWLGSDGGVSYTSDITTTSTSGDPVNWISENHGYLVSQFYMISMKKDSTDNTLLGGAQDNGSPFFKASTNLSSTSLDVSSGDGIYAYLGTNYGYAGSDNGTVYRNKYDSNGDITINTPYTDVTPPNASNQLFVTPYTIDPKAENIMYYLAGDSLWRNTHVTGSSPKNYWYTVSKLKAPSQYVLSSLNVSHKPAHILYVGASTTNMQSTTDLPIVYRIENSDTSSTVINRGSSQFPAGAYISDIAVNPMDANKIMVIFSNYNVP
ncbi:MAG TPA: hypothetical protein VKA34_09810, partial [Balneolales bacterium]|nr:hypothetical protein [Balneolales bacterium]